jgi:hypothetical protein
MIILRCTQRLLKRSKVDPADITDTPTAPLGEWFANVMALPFKGESSVLFVNKPTRLVVITRGTTLRTTLDQFSARLPRLLTELGVPADAIEVQLREMADTVITTTDDRAMLGSMNDIAHSLRARLEMMSRYDDADFDYEEELLATVPFLGGTETPYDALVATMTAAGVTMNEPTASAVGRTRRSQPSVAPSAIPRIPTASRPSFDSDADASDAG